MSTAPTGLAVYVAERESRHLIRIDFRDGVEVTRAEIPVPNNRVFYGTRPKVFEGRIAYTNEGAVVDLTNGGVKAGPGLRLIGIDGRRLVVDRGHDRGLWTVDLDTFGEAPLPPPTRWHLPGTRSLGGTRTVSSAAGGDDRPYGGELWLHEFGRPPHLLAEGLRVSSSEQAQWGRGPVPRVWVDEGRLLTQRDNGELIVLGLDGAIRAEITIPLDEPDRRPAAPPEMGRDLDGRIIYRCHHWFRIDPDHREWGAQLWWPLGHGFAMQAYPGPDGRRVTYRGADIGPIHITGPPGACPGHLLAQLVAGGDWAVWSEPASWRPIGVNTNCPLGWVDRREEMT